MQLNSLTKAIIISLMPATTAIAAGLDRSGQSISAFLQPGNYAEAGISILDPEVKGKDRSGNNVSDMGDDYYFPSTAIKIQATDNISLGLLYDQPYGADATYQVDGSNFSNKVEGTSVAVETNNLTALIGYQPNENWNFYAGPVWQTVEAKISLRGDAYAKPPTGTLSGYNIKVEQEEAYGWAAGFSYQIPEIALKAAVTYRSEIKHKAQAKETMTTPVGIVPLLTSNLDAITPQSVNLDLQTGISPKTLAFANLRWVHWDNFVVTPQFLADTTTALGAKQNLIDYTDDQYSATVGLSHKFNNKWASTAAVGYDSGAGNPVTILGPTEGYWSLGLGGQYSPAENYFIQAGVKYFWLGDAQAQTGGTIKADFADNHAIGYGLKMGYRF